MKIENEIEKARKVAFTEFKKNNFYGTSKGSFLFNDLKITVRFSLCYYSERVEFFEKDVKRLDIYDSKKFSALWIASLLKTALAK